MIHHDIAARNVFVDEALRGRIGDLGLARQLNENKEYKASVDRPRPIAVSYLCLLFILSFQKHQPTCSIICNLCVFQQTHNKNKEERKFFNKQL